MGTNEQTAIEISEIEVPASARPRVRPGFLRLLGASGLALVGVLVLDQVVASSSPAAAAHTVTVLAKRAATPSFRVEAHARHPRHLDKRQHHHAARWRHHTVILPVAPSPAPSQLSADASQLSRSDAIAKTALVAQQQLAAHVAAVAKAAELAKQQLAKAAELAKQQLAQQQTTPAPRPAKHDPVRRDVPAPSASSSLLLSLTENVTPSPDFMASCGTPSDSVFCLGQEIEAIDNARALEGLGPMTLDVSALAALSAAQQIFVLTDLERTARGLAPAKALTAQLDATAATAAAQDTDPSLRGWTLSGQKQAVAWNANWSGGLTATSADYYWMYSDGTGYNVDCTAPSSAGCWEHRGNILSAPAETCGSPSSTPQFVMGAAEVPTASYSPSDTEIIVQVCGGLPNDAVFTWAAAEQLLGISAN